MRCKCLCQSWIHNCQLLLNEYYVYLPLRRNSASIRMTISNRTKKTMNKTTTPVRYLGYSFHTASCSGCLIVCKQDNYVLIISRYDIDINAFYTAKKIKQYFLFLLNSIQTVL